jgi:nitrogen fixation protein NifU and related proteins
MFSQRLLDHFQNPRNVGELPPPAVTVEVGNPACGDILRLSVLFDTEGEVEQVRYRTRGCTASIAAGSALTEWVLGRTRSELRSLTTQEVEQQVGGLTPESRHAAVLCVDAVKELLRQAV